MRRELWERSECSASDSSAPTDRACAWKRTCLLLTCLTTRAWVNGQATRLQLLRRFGVGPTLSYILSLIGVCVWMHVVCEGLCKIDKDGLPRKAGGKLICSSHMKHSETIWNYFNYFWILPGSWHKLRGSRGLWWRGRGADWHDFPWFCCDMLS